jgi:ClpP class serine protease
LGLVDALGGFDVALKLAKEAAKIPAGDDVNLVLYPRKKSFFETLTQKTPDSSESDAWAAAAVEIAHELQPVIGLLRDLGLTPNRGGVLMMPPVHAAQ